MCHCMFVIYSHVRLSDCVLTKNYMGHVLHDRNVMIIVSLTVHTILEHVCIISDQFIINPILRVIEAAYYNKIDLSCIDIFSKLTIGV